jgi:hypothetical protein
MSNSLQTSVQMFSDDIHTRRNSLGDFRSLTLRDLNESRLEHMHKNDNDVADLVTASQAPVATESVNSTTEAHGPSSLLSRFKHAKSNGRGSALVSSGMKSEGEAAIGTTRLKLPPLIVRRDSEGCIAMFRTINGKKCELPSPKRRAIARDGSSPFSRSILCVGTGTKIFGDESGHDTSAAQTESAKLAENTTTDEVEEIEVKEEEEDEDEDEQGQGQKLGNITKENLAQQEKAAIGIQARWRGSRARNPSNSLWAMELQNVGVIGYCGAMQSSFPNAYLLITVRNKWTSHVSEYLWCIKH